MSSIDLFHHVTKPTNLPFASLEQKFQSFR
jgi:hypothetical protein